MTTVAVIQSNYLPWKGYFDIAHDADLFVFYDDVQFTKNDWRNRNKIKTPKGTEWVTVPTGQDLNRLICEVELRDPHWQRRHWQTILQHYGKTPHFARYRGFFEDVYLGRQWDGLSCLNRYIVEGIARDFLGIQTRFADSRDFPTDGTKLDRLLDLLRCTGATRYISGPSARDYIDAQAFHDAGIDLVYKDYAGYPEYPQRFPPFEHAVSIVDLLCNTGPDAPWYIWGWRHSPVRIAPT